MNLTLFQTVLMNCGYLIFACIVMLSMFIIIYKIFDRFTKFDTSEQLKNNNISIGLLYCGLLIGMGIAIGLVVGFTL